MCTLQPFACSLHASPRARDRSVPLVDGREGGGGSAAGYPALPDTYIVAAGVVRGIAGVVRGKKSADPRAYFRKRDDDLSPHAGDAGEESLILRVRDCGYPTCHTTRRRRVTGGRPPPRPQPPRRRPNPFSCRPLPHHAGGERQPPQCGGWGAGCSRKYSMTRDANRRGIFDAVQESRPAPSGFSTPCAQRGEGTPGSCGKSA